MLIINYNSSWYKAYSFVFTIQKRIFKSIYVSDFKTGFLLQKLLLQSNSARLLSIRDVTQISSARKISGIDGKISLTFSERFQLNEYIRENLDNWFPSTFKKVVLIASSGESEVCQIPTIADRVWFELVRKSIEPAHEAIFSPRNFCFRFSRSLYQIQKSIFFNLNHFSYGCQKRFLKVCLPKDFFFFDISTILNNLFASRVIKLGILRSFKNGLYLSFCATCIIN